MEENHHIIYIKGIPDVVWIVRRGDVENHLPLLLK
jgi:hypothetical protein